MKRYKSKKNQKRRKLTMMRVRSSESLFKLIIKLGV